MSEASVWEDYAEKHDAEAPVGDNAKAVLDGQIRDLWAAEKEVAELEEKLAAAKKKLRNINENLIPATFDDMGLDDESIVSVDGIKVSIKKSVHASPKADRREELYDWLEQHGHGGIIKRSGVFHVGVGQEKKAKRWIKSIKAYPGSFIRKVEPSTLGAFVREQLGAGTEIPMELFGVFEKRVAQVKT